MALLRIFDVIQNGGQDDLIKTRLIPDSGTTFVSLMFGKARLKMAAILDHIENSDLSKKCGY